MEQILELVRRTGIAVTNILSPPKTATSGQVRLYGVAAWFAGLVIAAAGAASLMFLNRFRTLPGIAMLVGVFPLAGFGLMTIGGYRALSGKNEKVSSDLVEVTPLRVMNGLFCLLASLVIAGAAATVLLYYLEQLGIDPRALFRP